MRAILLDWLMDVCEAYNMHRETLYLATDFLDRYLSHQTNILKHHLQLIGITCLFVAAKVEEIYPPKLTTFAYVTDGACTEQEILDMEIVIMTTLKWKLTPITPASWVNVFLQILSVTPHRVNCLHFLRSRATRLNLSPPEPEDMHLVAPNYSGVDYVRALRIIDLTILDLQSFRFSYSALAASSIYHTKGRDAALGASGYRWEDLAPCVNWMAPFAAVVKKHDVPDVLPGISGISDEARHLIQSHSITLTMLEQVEVLSQTSKICSPMTHSEGLLTPPRSSKKRKKPSPGLDPPYF
jgi:cyclin E